jgi:glutamine synthetase
MKDNDSYALNNPLSTILNKPPHDFRRDDLIKVIEQNQIERITFHYVGIDGRLKELKIPIADKKRAERILAQGERVDGSSLFKGLVDTSVSDLYVVPEYRTAFLNPFDKGSLDFVCRFLDKNGNKAAFVPSNILSKASRLFHDSTGLELYALGELEFFLIFSQDSKHFPQKKQSGYHESSPFFKSGEILTEILRYLTQITHAVKYAHSEVGCIDSIESEIPEIKGKHAEQMEVEFLPRPIEEMADALVIGRWLIRNVAHKYGCIATFVPKLDEGIAGNGLHFHLQLMKNGMNIMEGSDGRLSDSALKLVGGLCEYADSLTAFGNTVASSYMRLVPNQEAPTRIFWSGLNRSALIRVPLAWSEVHNLAVEVNPQEDLPIESTGTSKTVEMRSADGSALIHLFLAGLAMAADWGFRQADSIEKANRLYVKGAITSKKDIRESFAQLPANCVKSAMILNQKRSLYEREGIFPASIIDYIVDLLKKEDVDVKKLQCLDDIRKVMHKDLHIH